MVMADNAWQVQPGVYQNALNLYVKNNGATGIPVPWTLVIKNTGYLSVQSSWNWTPSLTTPGTITGKASDSWENLLPNGGNTVNVGLVLSSNKTDFIPQSITLNGLLCRVTK